jgi:adenylyltransferase/sulfurtransferase
VTDLSLDATQLDRYSRHVVMDEVGPAGQGALLDGRVLVVGCGGLGSPVVQYLAAAGVGRLTLVDDDAVERSNLQRQVVHADADVGRPKVESAREYVAGLNPDVTVDARETRVDRSNAEEFVAGHDVVVDASDNFPTRYLLNDATRLAGTPLVHGAIYKFEGQATTLLPSGPCYRCLFPEAPEPGSIPDCATTGVLGVLPGVVGAVQATEAAKLLLGLGEPLAGRLLFYDAADTTFEEAAYEPRPGCPVCGEEPIDSLDAVTYEGGCSVTGS